MQENPSNRAGAWFDIQVFAQAFFKKLAGLGGAQRSLRSPRSLLDTPLLWALLAAMALLWPLGAGWGLAGAVLLAGVCCVGSVQSLGCVYVFLLMFDNMLPCPLLGGSAVRVVQLALLGRGVLAHARLRRMSEPYTLRVAVLTLAWCGLSFALKGLTADMLSFGVNIAALMALRWLLRVDTCPVGETLHRMLMTYVVGALTAVALGILYGRIVWLVGDALSGARFMGTHEPNFMAMFLDVAVAIWLFLAPKGRVRDALVLGVLGGALVFTGSLTGLCMAVLVLGGSLIALRKQGWALAARVARALVVAALLAGCAALVLHPPATGGAKDILGWEASTGVVSGAVPNYLSPEDYARVRRGEAALDAVLETEAQMLARREAEGSVPDLEPNRTGDAAERALGRIPMLGERFTRAYIYLRDNGIDYATSGRLGLMREKAGDYAALPLWQKLIGRGPDIEKTYFPLYQTLGYAHCSYLDLLTSLGALGLAGLLYWIYRVMQRRVFLGEAMPAPVSAALTAARWAVLLHAATLSMHLNRMFLFFFFG